MIASASWVVLAEPHQTPAEGVRGLLGTPFAAAASTATAYGLNDSHLLLWNNIKGGCERLFDKARADVRAWEKANVH